MDADYWFAKKIGSRFLFLGTHTPETRRERIREQIIARNLTDKHLGKTRTGDAETFRQAFERIYQHDLITGEPINA